MKDYSRIKGPLPDDAIADIMKATEADLRMEGMVPDDEERVMIEDALRNDMPMEEYAAKVLEHVGVTVPRERSTGDD